IRQHHSFRSRQRFLVARPVFTGRAANVDFAAGFIALIGRLPWEAVFFWPCSRPARLQKAKTGWKTFYNSTSKQHTPEQTWTKENHWFG
ncbi:MAG: hypothetical protein K1W05_07860, partial [Desulfovibrio sp.]